MFFLKNLGSNWLLGCEKSPSNKKMVGMLVPLKGGIGSIVHPPIGRKNTTYILPSFGGYMLPIPPFRGTSIPTIEVIVTPGLDPPC